MSGDLHSPWYTQGGGGVEQYFLSQSRPGLVERHVDVHVDEALRVEAPRDGGVELLGREIDSTGPDSTHSAIC